jgi:hypothetical protein
VYTERQRARYCYVSARAYAFICISALERFWNEPVAAGGSSYVARVEALELIVIGAAQTGGALPARAAALEQYSGL